MSSKLSMVKRWVAERMGDVEHERRVALIATRLYDLMKGLHQLNSFHRRMLELGAYLHDVGRSIDPADHPEEGARLILDEPCLPLNERERRCLAYLARYHRGKSPENGEDGILHRTDDRAGMRVALALLKAADALDGRKLPRPQVSILLEQRKLRVKCHLTQDSPKARRSYSRRKKFRLLEKVLDCRVEVRVKLGRATREALVA